MVTKPLTTEAIVITEKKMDMTLDEIIKMTKTTAAKPKKQRFLNKGPRFFRGNQDKAQKIQQYMNSRSALRQGVLAQKRSSFQGKSFPWASEAARKAAVSPFRSIAFNHNRAANWNKPRPGSQLRRQGNLSNGGNAVKAPKIPEVLPKWKPKTMDSLFANMKEQRMRSFTSTSNGAVRRGVGVRNHVRQPWLRGRFGYYQN